MTLPLSSVSSYGNVASPCYQQVQQASVCLVMVVMSEDPAFLAAFTKQALEDRLLVWSTKLLTITHIPLHQLQYLQNIFSMTNSMTAIVKKSRLALR